jgi:hypothetical protein
MLSEYEASVLTKFRMRGCQPPHSSRPVAGSAVAIGLELSCCRSTSGRAPSRWGRLGYAVAQPPRWNANSGVP